MSQRVGKYRLGATIGEGSFGKVKKAVNVETGEEVAVKIMETAKIIEAGMEERIKKEISIMIRIKHKNIVRLLDVLVSKSRIYLVIELMVGGELFYKIANSDRLSESVARNYFQQLISAVHFCHSHNIVHRDLKPENLLIDDDGTLKVTDFGLSYQFTEKDYMLKTSCGTPNYIAPEVLLGTGYDGRAADIWSCGIILYVLLCGKLPITDPDLEKLFSKILNAEISYPDHLSASARDLLERMLEKDPKKRIDMEALRNHEWFKVGLQDTSESGSVSGSVVNPFSRVKTAKVVKSLNAFQIVSKSGAMNLGRILRQNPRKNLVSYTRFTSTHHPEAITRAVMDILGNWKRTKVKQSARYYKIHVIVKVFQKRYVKFYVEIFKFTKDRYLIEFVKIAGEIFEFVNLARKLRSDLVDRKIVED